jgi:hypothetical protein
MKNKLKIFFVAILFCGVAVLPLQAQVNASNETSAAMVVPASPTNNATVAANDDSSIHPANIDFFPPGKLVMLIPIVAIIMGCSIPIIIVGLQIYFRHRKNKMLHETIRLMVEKGTPIPSEMFARTDRDLTGNEKPKSPRNDLRIGLIFIGIGIGIVILTGAPGYIILFMGVAFVVASLFEKNDKNDNQPPKI